MLSFHLNFVIFVLFSSVLALNLPENEINAIYEFYNTTNGDDWFPYKWKVSDILNNSCNLQFITCDTENNHITSIAIVSKSILKFVSK